MLLTSLQVWQVRFFFHFPSGKDILKGQKVKAEEILISKKRQEWATLIKINPQLNLKDLWALKPRVYVWLYENDPFWLKQNLPPKKIINYESKQYIDWEQRDIELKSQLENEAVTMYSGNKPPKQITKTALGKKLIVSH